MATKYARERYVFEASFASDYSRPYVKDEFSDTHSADDEIAYLTVDAETTGTTVNTSQMTTANAVAVINDDTSNYVAVTWVNNGTSNSQRLLAGEWLRVTGITVASNLTLTANTAACPCRVLVIST